ncbi:hypothetical protein Efla_007601 [Eimeria flavescens]
MLPPQLLLFLLRVVSAAAALSCCSNSSSSSGCSIRNSYGIANSSSRCCCCCRGSLMLLCLLLLLLLLLLQDLASCWYLVAALRLPDPALHAALHAAAAAAAAVLRDLRETAAAAAAAEGAPAAAATAAAAEALSAIGPDPLALLLRCMHTLPGSNATDAALQRALQLPPAAAAAAGSPVAAAAAAAEPLLLFARMQQQEGLHAELLLGLCCLFQLPCSSPAALVNALHACSSSSSRSSKTPQSGTRDKDLTVPAEAAAAAAAAAALSDCAAAVIPYLLLLLLLSVSSGLACDAVGLLLQRMLTPQFAAALRMQETVDVLQALLQLHAARMGTQAEGAAAVFRVVSKELLRRHRAMQQQMQQEQQLLLQQAVGPAAAAAVAAAKGLSGAALLSPPELVLWITAAAKFQVYDEELWDICASHLLLQLQQQMQQQMQQQQQLLLPLHLAAAAFACAAAPPGFSKPQKLLQRIAFAARKQLDRFSLPEISQLAGSLTRGGVDCRLLLSRCSVLLRRAAAAAAAAEEDLLQQQQLTGRHLVNLISAFSRQGVKEQKVFQLVAELLLSCRDTAARAAPSLIRTLEPQDSTALLAAFGKARLLHLPLLQELLSAIERDANRLSLSQSLSVLKSLLHLSHSAPPLQQKLLQQIAHLNASQQQQQQKQQQQEGEQQQQQQQQQHKQQEQQQQQQKQQEQQQQEREQQPQQHKQQKQQEQQQQEPQLQQREQQQQEREQQQKQEEVCSLLGISECLLIAEAAKRFSLILPLPLRQQLEACLPEEVHYSSNAFFACLFR